MDITYDLRRGESLKRGLSFRPPPPFDSFGEGESRRIIVVGLFYDSGC